MKFIFTCGGTAGHINPALAIAGRLRELMPDCEVLFIGAEGKMEMELVPREGYEIKPLKITNISRGHSLSAMVHNLETLKNVAVSTHEAKKIIRNFKPVSALAAMSATLCSWRRPSCIFRPLCMRAMPSPASRRSSSRGMWTG